MSTAPAGAVGGEARDQGAAARVDGVRVVAGHAALVDPCQVQHLQPVPDRGRQLQGDAAGESKWLALADKVAAAAKAALWRPELSAMFDKYEDDTCKDMPLDLNREWLDLPRSQNRMVGQG